MSDVIQASAAPKPVGTYPHARRVGSLLFLSGIGPRDPATNSIPGNEYFADGRVRKYDIEAQARAVFANVRAVLEASGARWEGPGRRDRLSHRHVPRLKSYNAVWAEHFPDIDSAPCRTTRASPRWPTPIAIELKCTAGGSAPIAARMESHAARPAQPPGLDRRSPPPAQAAGRNKVHHNGDFHRDDRRRPEPAHRLPLGRGPRVVLPVGRRDGACASRKTVPVRDIPIRAGETFLLPPRVPHSPQRMAEFRLGW
jgi:2-aminomuconate deaminase